MDSEQKYKFIDKTGHCFEDFQKSTKHKQEDEIDKFLDNSDNDGEKFYRDHVGAMLRAGKEFSVGDMFCFRDDLTDAGFIWGTDFYVIKV
jgi:hypothetical protein